MTTPWIFLPTVVATHRAELAAEIPAHRKHRRRLAVPVQRRGAVAPASGC